MKKYPFSFPQTWITIEDQPRRVTVKGVSQMDGDCLVGYLDDSTNPLWVLWDGKPDKVSPVIGLTKHPEPFIYAARVPSPPPGDTK